MDNDFEIYTVRPDGGFKDEALYTSSPQPYGELFVMRFDGTQVEQITDNHWEDAGPAWQPKK